MVSATRINHNCRIVLTQEPVGIETDLLRRWEERSIFPRFLVAPVFPLERLTMRLEMAKNCPRSPTRLATIAQVRQAPGAVIH